MPIEPWPYFICSGGQDHYNAWATKLQEDPWRKFKHIVSMALAEMNLPGVRWLTVEVGYLSIWNRAPLSPTYQEESDWYDRNFKEYWEAVKLAIKLALKNVPEIQPSFENISFYVTDPIFRAKRGL